MDQQNPHIYEFGTFRLNVSKRLLLRGGEPVPLTPKVFDTLLYLVEHSGTVLSKDELMAAIWPDTVVEENNLGQNISKLRVVLGESRGENRYIVTVPGTGYRFVADVKALAPENRIENAEALLPRPVDVQVEPAPALPQLEQRTGRLRGRAWRAVFIGMLVTVLGVSSFYLWRSRTRPAVDARIRTIAVLPFKPLVLENRDEALEVGMADTLISKLSNIREIIVRPISSVRRYGGVEQDPLAAGRELGVDAVLDGTIQRWGNRIRVNVRLSRVSDNTTLWADQFEQEYTNIFAIQDSISEQVAGSLALKLAGEERELLAKRYTADAEAYDLYLKGRFFWSKRTREGTRQAIIYFQAALERDRTYALAYAGLADSYLLLPIINDMPSGEAFPKAKEAVLNALEIDAQLAEAHAALGWINFWFDWDWKGSEKELHRALEINPNYPLGRLRYAHLLSNLGRHEEALEQMDRALKLDPLSPYFLAIKGQLLFQARRYQQGIDHQSEALVIEPNFWLGQLVLGKNYERVGRYAEALEAFRKAQEAPSDLTEAISLSGFTYAVSGRLGEAERMLRQLKAISKQRYVPPYNIALVYHGLGNSDETLRLLERAYEERDVRMVFLGVEPKWDTLRSDARFIKLMKRMNLP